MYISSAKHVLLLVQRFETFPSPGTTPLLREVGRAFRYHANQTIHEKINKQNSLRVQRRSRVAPRDLENIAQPSKLIQKPCTLFGTQMVQFRGSIKIDTCRSSYFNAGKYRHTMASVGTLRQVSSYIAQLKQCLSFICVIDFRYCLSVKLLRRIIYV